MYKEGEFMELISVIVPVYNVEKYLDECVNSILDQTYSNIEILLIDDGSTDNSPNICDFYEKQDNRVRVIHQQNGGLSLARNIGIEKSQGDFIVFVDSDDYISTDMLEVMINEMKKNIESTSILMCNFVKFDSYGNVIKKNNYNLEKEIIDKVSAIDRLIVSKDINYIVAWGKLYKKEVFDEIRFPLNKQNEDEFVMHKVYFNCDSIICLDKCFYKYRIRDNSIMNSKFSIKQFNKLEALYDRVNFCKKHNLIDLMNKAQQMYIAYFIDFYIKGMETLTIKKSIIRRKKIYLIKQIFYILKNKYINNREKIIIFLFAINYKLYLCVSKYLAKGRKS